MNGNSLNIIRNVLQLDMSLSDPERMAILQFCRQPRLQTKKDREGARLLSARDVARMLNISKRGVWRLASEGQLAPIKIGKRTTRFDCDEVLGLTRNEDQF